MYTDVVRMQKEAEIVQTSERTDVVQTWKETCHTTVLAQTEWFVQ